MSAPPTAPAPPQALAAIRVSPIEPGEILGLRTRQRDEIHGQIVHDSIHRRVGWNCTYRLETSGQLAGFGSVAVGGPWTNKPTVYEFYLLPEYRIGAFRFFESFLAACGATHFEVQTNDVLLTVMLHAYGRKFESERLVFSDQATSSHSVPGANLRQVTEDSAIQAAIERRQGGGEWLLELDGVTVGSGGILFHYNRPYGDIYMDVAEAFRRRGLGRYLVQELKRECYRFGAIPCARCSTQNLASRATLQASGFVPYAHIVLAEVAVTLHT